jgi:hypothetical protein
VQLATRLAFAAALSEAAPLEVQALERAAEAFAVAVVVDSAAAAVVVDFTEEEAVAAVSSFTIFAATSSDLSTTLQFHPPRAESIARHDAGKRPVTASYPGPLQQRCSTRVTPVRQTLKYDDPCRYGK